MRQLQFLIQPLQSHSLGEFRYLSKDGAIYGTQAYSPKLHDPAEAQEEAAALCVHGAQHSLHSASCSEPIERDRFLLKGTIGSLKPNHLFPLQEHIFASWFGLLYKMLLILNSLVDINLDISQDHFFLSLLILDFLSPQDQCIISSISFNMHSFWLFYFYNQNLKWHKMVFKFLLYLRVTLNFCFSCIHLACARITDRCHLLHSI